MKTSVFYRSAAIYNIILLKSKKSLEACMGSLNLSSKKRSNQNNSLNFQDPQLCNREVLEVIFPR